ncbi:metallophosphoesterase family protein [uncultured Bradyrhizobium sp.]|mgnify:FL=1|uniref:metallophosphoesterase family protein n=2 Tax=Pseudomonadota TaxID=1224 RepID=UPI0026395C14|nr:metallophosphoesterase family protein [uncultured Bradyrhizobium sp.]
MLERLRNILSKSKSMPRRQIPEGRRVYAIGDIHGRLDLLDDLLATIAADHAARSPAQQTLIFLGDLIDRGPHSAAVIDRVIALQRSEIDTRVLMGNHEEVFLKALNGSVDALRLLCRFGGHETILSYGMDEAAYNRADYTEVLRDLSLLVPDSHRAFLAQLEDRIEIGDYTFVHAGIRPGVALADQKANDLRWIRDDFIKSKADFGTCIVHGHTITPEVVERPNRIGIDTGAYATGRLSALALAAGERWILSTEGALGTSADVD